MFNVTYICHRRKLQNTEKIKKTQNLRSNNFSKCKDLRSSNFSKSKIKFLKSDNFSAALAPFYSNDLCYGEFT